MCLTRKKNITKTKKTPKKNGCVGKKHLNFLKPRVGGGGVNSKTYTVTVAFFAFKREK